MEAITDEYIRKRYNLEKEKEYVQEEKLLGELEFDIDGMSVPKALRHISKVMESYSIDSWIEEEIDCDGSKRLYVYTWGARPEVEKETIERLKKAERAKRKAEKEAAKRLKA